MKMTRPLFHALIAGHIRAGDTAAVERIGAMMNQVYPESDRDFIPAITTYARTGDIEKLLDSFVDMKSRALTPDVGDVLQALTAYTDWCVDRNKYPEDSALDSLFDAMKQANYMPGFNGIVCQSVVQLARQGFNEVAADLLCVFPQATMASREFFRRAIRTLPFTDVIRFCDKIGEAAGSNPMTEFCLPQLRQLPFDQLEQVLIDAKESDFPLEMITEIVKSKLPDPRGKIDREYLTGANSRGPSAEKVLLLAIQLELPVVKDPQFWARPVFDPFTPFNRFYERLTKGASKHDLPRIEAIKPAMIQGLVQYHLDSTNLDRVRLVADLLRANPDVEPNFHVIESVSFRLMHRASKTQSIVPDAIYVLKRGGALTEENMGRILERMTSGNPDPALFTAFTERAMEEDAWPKPFHLHRCLDRTSDEEMRRVVMQFVERRRADFLEKSVLEKMTLEELLEYQRTKKPPSPDTVNYAIVARAAAEGQEEEALKALAATGNILKTQAIAAVFEMYVNTLGDGFKALEYLDVLIQEARLKGGVAIPVATMVRLVEILLKNGRTLADLQLFDEVAQAEIKLSSSYGMLDRSVVADHVAFISHLNEDQAAIDAYLNRLVSLKLGSHFEDTHVSSILKERGVRAALDHVKTLFNERAKEEEIKRIPGEEQLLDAIVQSEDVGILKDFLDVSYVVHGERDAFLRLAIALYKGGKYAQGRRILNVPGLRSEDGLVPRLCEKLLAEKRYDALENLCDDICCVFGVDKSQLAFFKLRSLMARGDNVKAMEYFNQLLNANEPLNDQLRSQAASLYERLSLEFYDKAVVAQDYNQGHAEADVHSTFDGNVPEVLKNIRGGQEYPREFLKHLVQSLGRHAESVLDALAQRRDLATLEFLATEIPVARIYVGLTYLREDRLPELLEKYGTVEKPEQYLTPDHFQYLRTKENTDDLIRQIEDFATSAPAPALIRNLVSFHLSVMNIVKAKSLIEEHPVVLQEGDLPLIHVNPYTSLLALTEMEIPESIKGRAFRRLIHNAILWRAPSLIKEAVEKLVSSNIEFHIPTSLRRNVKSLVGEDLFPARVKKEAPKDAADSLLEGMMDDMVEDVSEAGETPAI